VAVALANKMVRMAWRCWPMVAPIGRLSLLKLLKVLGDEEKRRCNRVHELQG
jgi:hypothetical protein